MKNIEKSLQEKLMAPILKKFNSRAKCEKCIMSNYFWIMCIANENGVIASINIQLKKMANTHSGIIISFSTTDYAGNVICSNEFSFDESKIIDEIKAIIEEVKKYNNINSYYIL